ncbi:hypothetical protein RDABS01_022724, partial [Bienertia sinuspersici]
MATRSLLKITAKLMAATTAIAGGTAGASILTSDDPSATYKLWTSVPLRLFRDTVTAATIAFDYEYSLLGIPEGSTEYLKMKHEVHLRGARKLQDLCFRNGGIYIKLGQHISQLEYLVPEEYVNTMRESMLNRCPVSSYDQVCDVIKKELGGMPDEVQHTHMTDTAAADYATVELIVNTLHRLFPSFDYRWLVAEVRDSLPK